MNFLNADKKCANKPCSESLSEKELHVKTSEEKSPRKTTTEVCSPGKETLSKEGLENNQQPEKEKSPEKQTPITTKELIGYAWQISRGMSYLVEMKVGKSWTLADPAAGFRWGVNLARGPNLGYPQN